MHKSRLQESPRSKILKKGYINIYSKLTPQENRQILYKTLYKKINPDWDDGMVYLSRELGGVLTTKSKLLDIGCGNGNYLIDENRKEIPWAVGIDVDRSVTAKNICLDKIIYGKVEKLPYPEKSFNIINGLWVFEHLDNPKAAFSEIYRVLDKGGFFFFITPNYDFLPLKMINLISNNKLNWFLNKKLFGRSERDVFKTFYRINTVHKIKSLAKGSFKINLLRTNYDPGYTSFSMATFRISNVLERILSIVHLGKYFHPHIIGILEKK